MDNQRPAEPSVNIFIRTLNFPFVMGDVLGIPRALQDPGSPPNADCALLVHELSHMHAFMYPLGRLYTALALRLKDLHDEAAKLHNAWLALTVNGGLPDHEKSLEAVNRVSRTADYAMRILTLLEYTRPLLEGLATCAEMEMPIEAQNETASVIATMEWWHAFYLALLENPPRLSSIQSPAFTENILNEFEKQIEESRRISRLIRAEGILFEEHPDSDGTFATTPYFLGYLFIRKLLQEWSAKAPDLSRADLYGIANACICTILPLTLLYTYLAEEESAPESRAPFLSEETIVAVIESFSDLEPPRLRRIREGGLIAIDLHKDGLVDITAGNNAEYAMMRWILVTVFPELDEAKVRETEDLLWQCERAKFFHRTYTAESMVFGVDPVHKRALLADLATTKRRDEGIEASYMIWFLFKDDEEYKRFISLYESRNAKIPRVEQRSGKEFRVSSSEIVVASNLSAYFIFYPTGIGSAKEPAQFKTPLEIVWRFGPDRGAPEEMFFTKSTSVHDNEACIYWQDLNLRLLAAFNQASDTSFKMYSGVLGDIVDLYQRVFTELFDLSAERAFHFATQKDKSEKLVAKPESQETEDEDEETDEERLGNYCLRILAASKRCLDRNNVEQYKAMLARCRALYVNRLFPEYDQPDLLASRKLSILDAHLPSEDLNCLRTWLLYGAAFDQIGCYVVDEDDALSVAATAARISSVCSSVLGVPLVRYQPDSRSITLDLLES